jgi:rfaE bifunctional protein nucleotidyltransferase chain/domain
MAIMQQSHESIYLKSQKLLTLADAVKHREMCRLLGKSFVLTNGCFDLLHMGHIYALEQAALQGDCLWVLLNASVGIKQLKGPSRPIQTDLERAYALGALSCVSGVTLFDTQRIVEEICLLQPDVYVKSGDYTLERLHPEERLALESVGAKIVFIPFLKGFSTTHLLERLNLGGATC